MAKEFSRAARARRRPRILTEEEGERRKRRERGARMRERGNDRKTRAKEEGRRGWRGRRMIGEERRRGRGRKGQVRGRRGRGRRGRGGKGEGGKGHGGKVGGEGARWSKRGRARERTEGRQRKTTRC